MKFMCNQSNITVFAWLTGLLIGTTTIFGGAFVPNYNPVSPSSITRSSVSYISPSAYTQATWYTGCDNCTAAAQPCGLFCAPATPALNTVGASYTADGDQGGTFNVSCPKDTNCGSLCGLSGTCSSTAATRFYGNLLSAVHSVQASAAAPTNIDGAISYFAQYLPKFCGLGITFNLVAAYIFNPTAFLSILEQTVNTIWGTGLMRLARATPGAQLNPLWLANALTWLLTESSPTLCATPSNTRLDEAVTCVQNNFSTVFMQYVNSGTFYSHWTQYRNYNP